MLDHVFFIVLAMPLAWSAGVAGLRHLTIQGATPDDATEKYQLLIMLLPILVGALWLVAQRWLPAHIPLPPLSGEGHGGTVPHVFAERTLKHAVQKSPWLVPGVLGLWALVTLARLAPLGIALVRLGRVKAHAVAQEIDGAVVHVTAATVPPLAWGGDSVILPSDMVARFAPGDLCLIIRHEQAHLARRDPAFFAALALVDALLWFNPFIRTQSARCRLAAELACDAMAAGKNPEERETYARVLIKTLKHTAGDVLQHAPAAISNVKSGD